MPKKNCESGMAMMPLVDFLLTQWEHNVRSHTYMTSALKGRGGYAKSDQRKGGHGELVLARGV